MRKGRDRLPSLPRALAVLLWFMATSASAEGRTVQVPMRLDYEFLRQGLLKQVYTEPDRSARVWDDGSGCNFLILSDPQVEEREGRIRILTAGEARIGTPLGDQCFSPFSWSGFLEVFEEAYIESGVPIVSFRVVDSNVYGRDMRKALVTGTLWDWVKKHAHPRLEALHFDLHSPLADLRAFLPLVLPSHDAERIQRLLESVSLAGVQPVPEGLVLSVRMDVPERADVIAEPTAEPTLTPEEVQRWERAWQSWDAFLTFVVKSAGEDSSAEDLRRELLGVLLDSRHDILAALRPSRPEDPDPVRPLFLKSWRRLAPVMRRIALRVPGEEALHYMSFIAAADALKAIDELGPDIGLEISADGLRRLARMVAPQTTEDPLAYSVAVDPELRRIFGFGPPLPPPEPNPAVDLSRWFWSAAWAAEPLPPATLKRLNSWAPQRAELDEYLPLIRDLLQHTSATTLENENLQSRFQPIYRWSMLATAWQETCWRQFVKSGATVKPIRSKVGSIGLMQVNQNVWRGFYDVTGLQRDIAYNARAGGEILLRYLVDYAIAKGEHEATGNIHNLARATYAVYNGGPRHLKRYRLQKTSKHLRKIDQAFWQKYQSVKSGKELDVARCFGGG